MDTGARFDAERRARVLAERYRSLDGVDLLRPIVAREFPGRIAVVSSFGAEAAVLLRLVAVVDPAIPVVFLDTGKHFPHTLVYRETLACRLGLTDVRVVRPGPDEIAAANPDGDLWHRDPDACCALRKVRPLARALEGFDAWITGRKRAHGAARADLPVVEAEDGRVKINPLAPWSVERIAAAFAEPGLPHHPLTAQGYLSIGCATCTRAVAPGEGARDGRWAGLAKTECGIHRAPWARDLPAAGPPDA